MSRASLNSIVGHYDFLGRSGLYDLIVDYFLLGRDPALRRKLLTAPRIARGARVLDVGTGTGRNLPILVDLVGPDGAIVGIDVSTGMLSRAKKRSSLYKNVQLVCADASAYDHGEKFDVIVASYVFSVAPDPPALAAQLGHLLAKGGQVLILEAGLPRSNSRILNGLVRFEEWIAAADLRVDIPALFPETGYHLEESFGFWKYINGYSLLARVPSSPAEDALGLL